MLYPIRPPLPQGVLGEDPGFANPAESPVPICGNGDVANPEDESDVGEGGMCIRIGKGYSEPQEPTPEMINRHNLTHLPYRSWCPHCVAARRANAPHKSGSQVRQKPVFVADYCFISDSKTEGDNLTALVGAMYPPKSDAPKALFAVICERKGASDEYTASRLCQFIRECGASEFVYKSDQEASVVALIHEVVRRSTTPGDLYYGLVTSAVPENSAVGESQSNARAERSVQSFEDLLRTYKSALEARISAALPSDHAVIYWMAEHVAHVYNRHFVGADGRTAYEALHGKAASQKLVEFGEKVMWFVPKKLRLKLDLRWRLGIYLGQSPTSNENLIGLPNGNVVKARAINRVVQSGRWDAKMILAVQGIPGKPSVARQDLDFDSVEARAQPHASDDAASHDKHEGEGGDGALVHEGTQKEMPVATREIRITKRDLDRFGYEPGCPRCEDIQQGKANTRRHHNDACRMRMYCHFHDTNHPKWKAVAGRLEAKKDSGAGGDFDKLDLEALEAEFDAPNLIDEEPAPPTPLQHAEHFEPPSHVASGMEQEEEEGQPSVVVDAVDPSFADLLGDDDVEMDHDGDATMMHVLRHIGVAHQTAANFVASVANPLSTFMEIYGRGGLVEEANRQRRSLNVEGLGAFDLRTTRPDGKHWDFNCREDRKLARQMVRELQPQWIIGSPPCTSYSAWNEKMNYPKMDPDKVQQMKREGRRHLQFCINLYRRQLSLGRHFFMSTQRLQARGKNPICWLLAGAPG